jgi:hypothetical protein
MHAIAELRVVRTYSLDMLRTIALLAVALTACGADEPEVDPHLILECPETGTCEQACLLWGTAPRLRGCDVAINPTEGERDCETTFAVEGVRGCCVDGFSFALNVDRFFICEGE